MKNLIGQQFGNLTVLKETDNRKNGCILWECQCKCGNIIQVSTSDLTCGRKKSCGCLEQNNKKQFGQRSKAYNFKDRTNQRYGRLVALYPTDKRSGSSVVWHCKCDCGNELDINGSYLGKSIFSCGCLRKDMAREKGIEKTENLIGQKFGKLTVLSYVLVENSKTGGSHWLCQCDCGNQIVVKKQYLRLGKTTSCGCVKIKSKGQQKIAEILKSQNISFIQEKKFDDCRFPDTNFLARFDFYVNNSYLIEYDGQQHYYDGYYSDLNKTQFRDNIKNQYCKQHNIPLIRIPYTHLNDICLEDLQVETSKFKI